jgi:outer membrane receptor for ferrienterochelin and colicins
MMKKQLIFLFSFILFSKFISAQTKNIETDSIKKGNTAIEEITISSMRTASRIENIPTRIEVLGLEEMREENGVKPGSILSLLGDIAGIQMQQASASTGSTMARIQGLNGRYTQILRDGMPGLGGLSSNFSIMQIPPLDLKQIEIIKGSMSTLYGGDAIGGIINLVSKNPTTQKEFVVTLNQTTLNENNINAYYAQRIKNIGFSLFAGNTYQKFKDLDKDTLSDVPNVKSLLIHPRVVIYFNKKSTLTLNSSFTKDTRNGGDTRFLTNNIAANNGMYHIINVSTRLGFDATWHYKFSNNLNLTLKQNTSQANLLKEYSNNVTYFAKQLLYYTEASVLYKQKSMDWVAGLNFNGDNFKDSTYRYFNPENEKYNYNTIGAFAQNSWHVNKEFIIESGLRIDHHNQYGNFYLPRISLMYKPNSSVTMRATDGYGYKIPFKNSYIDGDDFSATYILYKSTIKAEKSNSLNADINYTFIKNDWNITFNQSAFYTTLKDPIVTVVSPGQWTWYELRNAAKPIVSKGLQTYSRIKYEDWEIYLGYIYTNVQKNYDSMHRYFAVTPKHNFSTTLFYELGENLRVGLEASYIAGQLTGDYFHAKNYALMAAMAQYNYKKITFVLNCENLLDVRQSKFEKINENNINYPVFRKLYAPIDGRVLNLSAKYRVF